MTSRHCFFKIMKEDFRHKIWMLALSILGNLLAMPVVFLIYAGNVYSYVDEAQASRILRAAGNVAEFFTNTLCITGGIIAVAGAVIVGLASFRYVFHRNMIDTYHSIPVKRRTLFAASWLNGFLIWFVPFLVMLVFTMLLGVGKFGRLQTSFQTAAGKTPEITEAFASLGVGDIFREGMLTAVVLTVAFLLVYHLILLAVMFGGNVLNALAMTMIFGVGAISLYGLWVGYEGYYLDTFMTNLSFVQEKMVYASPLASACYLLYARIQAHLEESYAVTGLAWRIVINLVIALLLGLAAAFAYEKRPSELAEQGVKNRVVRFVAQIVTTIGAGMGGWLLFYAITGDISGEKTALVWGVFGGVLASVLVFGVMDIIFNMDFKAFFGHKILMAATTAAVLLLCFGFCFDWVGYDAYLPAKERIVSMSVSAPMRNNLHYSYMYDYEQLNQVKITDADAIYAFLESATAEYRNGESRAAGSEAATWDVTETRERNQSYRSEDIRVRVTLKGGRSYCRVYRVYSYDNETALKILASPEYLDAFYRIPESMAKDATSVRLQRDSKTEEFKKGKDIDEEQVRRIIDGYNQDLLERPEEFISGDGNVLCVIRIFPAKTSDSRYLTVYESMEHTREALRECGFAYWADSIAAEEIEEIRIYSDVWAYELEEDEDINLLNRVREQYGVYDDEGTESNGTGTVETVSVDRPEVVAVECSSAYGDDRFYLSVTEKEEIRELLELISYTDVYYNPGAFQKELRGELMIVTKDEKMGGCYVYEGTLPEKYILRFQQ